MFTRALDCSGSRQPARMFELPNRFAHNTVRTRGVWCVDRLSFTVPVDCTQGAA